MIEFLRPGRAFLAAAVACALTVAARGEQTPAGISQAQADFLRALNLADGGSRPEALALLGESLRLQPADNPAAGVTFQLLTESRTGSSLRLRGHHGAINSAAYSPDGGKIVTASDDGTARIWDARTGRPLGPALKHEDGVKMAVFSPDGTRVATASADRTARVWDVASGEAVTPPIPAPHEMQCVRFSPDGTLLATGADEGIARLWDARTGEPKSPPTRYHGGIFSIKFQPRWHALCHRQRRRPRGPVSIPRRVSPPCVASSEANSIFTAIFSPDGARVADGLGQPRPRRIWDAA